MVQFQAQNAAYYQSVLETTQNPLIKLEALDSLISKSKATNTNNLITYSIAYIDLAKKLDSIEAAAKKMIGISYTLTSQTNQADKVVRMIDELLARKYKIKSSYLLGNLYLKRGGANYRLNLEQATKDYQKAIETFSEKDSIYKADAYLFSGQAYSNLGQFVPASENYHKAYDYYESLKDYEYMQFAQQGITTMYSMNGFYDKAMEERKRNIKKVKELGLDSHLVIVYYNQALDYKKQGKKALQLEELLKSYGVIQQFPEKIILVDKMYVFAALIEYYLEAGNLEAAKKYYDIVQESHDPEIQDLLYLGHYNEIMAKYALAHDDPKKALPFALKKLEGAQSLKYGEDIIESQELLAEIYTAQGNYKNALESKEIAFRLRDSVYNSTTANSLAYYQTLYETEKKEKEIVAQNANIQLLESKNLATRKRMALIIVALILSFGIIILFRNRMQIKQKKNLQEKFSQELLVSQEEERKRISKDLHDGLGQQLLIVKNKLIQNQDGETKKMVEHAIEDVRSISRNLHPFQLQELGITKAIEMTINQIDENTTLFISSEIDNIDHIFDKKQEVNLYRIVQESLTNIVKHAQAEAGKVTLKRSLQGISLVIRDNGIGFDFTEKYQNLRSLGLKTLLERTKFLKGQMKVTSKKNKGTILEFFFPTV